MFIKRTWFDVMCDVVIVIAVSIALVRAVLVIGGVR